MLKRQASPAAQDKIMLSEDIESYEIRASERRNVGGKSLDALRNDGSIYCMVQLLHED